MTIKNQATKPTMFRNLMLAALISAPLAYAADDHGHSGHEHQSKAHHEHHASVGPNGGRLIQSAAGVAFEIVVDKQRRARLTSCDAHGKAVAPGDIAIHGMAGERSNPVNLAFAKGSGDDAGVLVSDKALPAGAHIPMILVIKAGPDAKPVTERFVLHLH